MVDSWRKNRWHEARPVYDQIFYKPFAGIGGSFTVKKGQSRLWSQYTISSRRTLPSASCFRQPLTDSPFAALKAIIDRASGRHLLCNPIDTAPVFSRL